MLDRTSDASVIIRWPKDVPTLTTSEQMYFCGAPLAHVIEYEMQLREERLRRLTARRSNRAVAF